MIFTRFILITICLTWITLILFPTPHSNFWWALFLVPCNIYLATIIISYIIRGKENFLKVIGFIFLIVFLSNGVRNVVIQQQEEKKYKNNPYVIVSQEIAEYIYKDSGGQNFTVLYKTSYEYNVKYMLWYVGHKNYRNSSVIHNIDMQYLSNTHEPTPYGSLSQYQKLKKGIVYLVIDKSQKKQIITFGKVLAVTSFGDNLIVEKRKIE